MRQNHGLHVHRTRAMVQTMSATFSIPDEVRIRGRLWRVALANGPHDEHRIHWQHAGVTKRDPRLILIDRALRIRDRRSTFLHELLHACVHQPSPPLDEVSEERFIAHVEAPLLRALEQLTWT